MVYYNEPALLGSLPRDQGVHDRVQDAIDTILDRQDESGEFGLWRVGDGEASTWLGVYALDFLTHAKEAGFVVPESALDRSALWLRRAAEGNLEQSAYQYYAQGSTVTRAYADYVLARLGRADLGDLRRLHDTLQRRAGGSDRIWLTGGDDAIEPLALGQMAGAFSLMGDHPRASDTFRMAIDNLALREWPNWWFDWSYASPLRDTAGLIAVAAETGQQDVLAPLLDHFTRQGRDPASFNTQEQAALLSAAHALNKGVGPLAFSVERRRRDHGQHAELLAHPREYRRRVQRFQQQRPLAVAHAIGDRQPTRSLPGTFRRLHHRQKLFLAERRQAGSGAPAAERPHHRRTARLYDGRRCKPSHRRRRPAAGGWEIEAPIGTTTEYSFLGPMSATRVREARDDRFVAAMDFGSDLRQWRYRIEEVNDDKPHLADNEFRVAYVARVITPGHFTLPEAVVQDMYRPAFMARTVAAVTDVVKR